MGGGVGIGRGEEWGLVREGREEGRRRETRKRSHSFTIHFTSILVENAMEGNVDKCCGIVMWLMALNGNAKHHDNSVKSAVKNSLDRYPVYVTRSGTERFF